MSACSCVRLTATLSTPVCDQALFQWCRCTTSNVDPPCAHGFDADPVVRKALHSRNAQQIRRLLRSPYSTSFSSR